MIKALAHSLSIGAMVFAVPACAHPHSTPTPQPVEAVAASDLELGPALWKVADEDTTIYLFGTVHVLPEGVEWYSGPIKSALASSDQYVTEVNAQEVANAGPKMIAAGTLSDGTSLRSLLAEEDRNKYEAALKKMNIPVNTFDKFEPWFAALQLSMLPLLLDGWNPEAGVETVLHKSVGESKQTDQLETAQFQINMFDSLPQETQLNYLNQTVASLPEVKTTMDAIVNEWAEGDVEAIGELNTGSSDNQMYQIVFSDRNKTWAGWIDDRLDTPGTVFVAVGAGHLAGKDSVQDYLAERGITVTRLQ